LCCLGIVYHLWAPYTGDDCKYGGNMENNVCTINATHVS
jgi:hypothetical protein